MRLTAAYRWRYNLPMDTRNTTDRPTRGSLHDAFGELNALGYLAREDFSCCSGCAGYELTELAVQAIKAGRTAESIRGWIAQHEDAENFASDRDFYLAYGPMESTEFGMIGRSDEEVGREVVQVLAKHGVQTEWNGDGRTRILVRVASVSDPRPEIATEELEWDE